jgi:hypothetical protein
MFALLASLCGFFMWAADLGPDFTSIKLATLVFTGLFCACVVTRFVGRRA